VGKKGPGAGKKSKPRVTNGVVTGKKKGDFGLAPRGARVGRGGGAGQTRTTWVNCKAKKLDQSGAPKKKNKRIGGLGRSRFSLWRRVQKTLSRWDAPNFSQRQRGANHWGGKPGTGKKIHIGQHRTLKKNRSAKENRRIGTVQRAKRTMGEARGWGLNEKMGKRGQVR